MKLKESPQRWWMLSMKSKEKKALLQILPKLLRMAPMKKVIPLSQIKDPEPKTTPTMEYTQYLAYRPEKNDPLFVASTQEGFVLLDGRHRVAALEFLKEDSALCWIFIGTRQTLRFLISVLEGAKKDPVMDHVRLRQAISLELDREFYST